MINIGLTGSIGSGKTLVARIFEALDVPVFYADIVARELLKETHIKNAIVQRFGTSVLDQKRQIVNKRLAAIVFGHSPSLNYLNDIIHPEVRKKLHAWKADHAAKPYIIHEAAILFESGFNTECEQVIVVSAPEELRIQRVMKRDGISSEEVRQRIDNQWPEEEKIRKADFVIINDGQQLVIPQVLEIHRKLLNTSIWKS